MPHKDRAARLAYLAQWKLKNRPAPRPAPQVDPALPARGIMAFSASGTEVQCHSCGCWFGSLNTHLKMHGLDARSYKELFGLPRTASLLPPVTAERYREAALARDQGSVGREHLPITSGRPKGQEARLGVRVRASEQRLGVYTRGGEKVRDTLPVEKKKAEWTPDRRAKQVEVGRRSMINLNIANKIFGKDKR